MSIRVHELAKEFKISTAALKKHLLDMGVVVKSHMSPLDDDVVSNIRGKFTQATAAVKQKESDRKSLHRRIVQTERKREEDKQKAKQAQVEAEKQTKVKATPVFTEKTIKKTPTRIIKLRPEDMNKDRFSKGAGRYKKPGTQEKGPYKPAYKPAYKPGGKPPYKPGGKPPYNSGGFAKKTPPSEQTVPIIPVDTHKGEKKKKTSEFENKNKHLDAKLKNMTKGGRKKKFIPSELEEAQISRNIKKTLTTSKKKKYKKEEQIQSEIDTTLTISEFTSVSELSKLMNKSAAEIIGKFFMMGQMVTINQRLDKESLEMICDEFEFDVEFQEEYGTEILEEKTVDLTDVETVGRPPIVTVMGHVDHGKTSILDYIRKTNIIAGESGGITQHIGAYQVIHNEKKITFLDTPGHEAFAAMRARGANVTDIAIIVVAANESVKPQTVEAIDHAKAAGVQIIVAMNKIDLKEANIDRTVGDLMRHNLMLEGYGGDVLWVPCSAVTGEGIDELLETLLLAAEMLEIQTPKDVKGRGIVIEAQKDSRMGTVVTVLLQEGSLSKGDDIVCGATYGRVRKMEDERNKELKGVGASDVAVVYGLTDVPKAGDILNVVDNKNVARQISAERTHIRQEREKYQIKTNLDNLFQKIKESDMNEVKLIVKADTDGSVEALCDSFQKLSTEEVKVNIIRKAVGGINEADVNMASASDAVIIGFHVRANSAAKRLADDENIEIKIYQIIYEAIEDLQKAMSGMLAPELKEKYLGTALVKQVFRIKKVGSVAGCYVEKGMMTNSGRVRLYRNDIMIHEGELAVLKHYADEVKEVKAGSECGIRIDNYNDIKEGDILENFIIEEIARKI
jgi:translation initiation factor IF-2